MKQRIITAMVLMLIVALCMFSTRSVWPMLLLSLAMAAAMSQEWLKLTPMKLAPQLVWVFMAAVVGLTALLTIQSNLHLQLDVWGISSLFWILALIWVKRYPIIDGWYGRRLVVIGPLLIIATCSAMVKLWQFSPWWLLYVFGLVWSADSGAYFAGRAFGRHKLSPGVSPGKTIEGLIGGMSASLLLIAVVILTVLPKLSSTALWYLIGLSIGVSLISALGDLFESMLKRRAGIKDSGDIFPGHGGILDRTDSLLAAIPLFAFGFFNFGGF